MTSILREAKALQGMERQSELEETPLKKEEGSEEIKRKEDVLIRKVLV